MRLFPRTRIGWSVFYVLREYQRSGHFPQVPISNRRNIQNRHRWNWNGSLLEPCDSGRSISSGHRYHHRGQARSDPNAQDILLRIRFQCLAIFSLSAMCFENETIKCFYWKKMFYIYKIFWLKLDRFMAEVFCFSFYWKWTEFLYLRLYSFLCFMKYSYALVLQWIILNLKLIVKTFSV